MKTFMIIGMIATVFFTTNLVAGEGKALFEKSCTGCHGTEVFTREKRSIETLEGLKSRVKQCSLAADSQWGDDDIKTVVDYLNKNFYKF